MLMTTLTVVEAGPGLDDGNQQEYVNSEHDKHLEEKESSVAAEAAQQQKCIGYVIWGKIFIRARRAFILEMPCCNHIVARIAAYAGMTSSSTPSMPTILRLTSSVTAALTGMAGYDLPFVGEKRDWRDDWIIVGAVVIFATLHCASYFPNMAISMMMKMFAKIAE